MNRKRAFVSFDYDNDSGLKEMLIGQSRHDDTPFDIHDMSIKEPVKTAWKDNARTRIKGCDVVIVLCGQFTNLATGIDAELKIAQEEGIPYFLLKGYSSRHCVKPATAKWDDKMYDWTWPNLKALIHGER